MQDRADAGQGGCRTGPMQDRADAGQDECSTGCMQDSSYLVQDMSDMTFAGAPHYLFISAHVFTTLQSINKENNQEVLDIY